MNAIKITVAIFSAFLVILVCGYLFYIFFSINYLQPWLKYLIQGLCVVAVISAVVLCVVYIKGIEEEERRTRRVGKTKRVSTK